MEWQLQYGYLNLFDCQITAVQQNIGIFFTEFSIKLT